eukprot:CAMPEP_0198581660 /NCGR_PEP_ID=MMETSP1462-20131121/124520_1 /TAXON_ID=1333877 /ORGANISM="Brandtodinium nutriculum, Strain RCC3387" /LENGTH=33 /DNA_ID= /DNA_START= /DNA_END= /DNA_ORIENTATION=
MDMPIIGLIITIPGLSWNSAPGFARAALPAAPP